MPRVRRIVSGFVCATIVASSVVAFSAPVNAWGGTWVPSNTMICRLLRTVEQLVNRLPGGDLKTALLAEISEELSEHNCP